MISRYDSHSLDIYAEHDVGNSKRNLRESTVHKSSCPPLTVYSKILRLSGCMDVDFMMSLMRSDNRFADSLFARHEFSGASGVAGVRARDSDDNTGGGIGGEDDELSCYMFIRDRSFPIDMSLGESTTARGHQFLDQKIRGAHYSLGNVLPSSLPHQLFPSDISLGICFPSDMSLAKRSECCWGKHRML
ncbi:hypothetical protein Tco_0307388 [Tanacetum coccineum]